jgi:DNA-binding XRE family transcriptional regulator
MGIKWSKDKRVLSEAEIAKIKKLQSEEGLTKIQLSERFGVSRGTISYILNGWDELK